jgi:hypothetical protein
LVGPSCWNQFVQEELRHDVQEEADRSIYLSRLAGPEVLVQAIRDGIALLTWPSDTFAYAESYDEDAKRYRGLRGRQMVSVSADSAGLLVKPDVARRQMDAETAATPADSTRPGIAAHESATSANEPGEPDAKPAFIILFSLVRYTSRVHYITKRVRGRGGDRVG